MKNFSHFIFSKAFSNREGQLAHNLLGIFMLLQGKLKISCSFLTANDQEEIQYMFQSQDLPDN